MSSCTYCGSGACYNLPYDCGNYCSNRSCSSSSSSDVSWAAIVFPILIFVVIFSIVYRVFYARKLAARQRVLTNGTMIVPMGGAMMGPGGFQQPPGMMMAPQPPQQQQHFSVYINFATTTLKGPCSPADARTALVELRTRTAGVPPALEFALSQGALPAVINTLRLPLGADPGVVTEASRTLSSFLRGAPTLKRGLSGPLPAALCASLADARLASDPNLVTAVCECMVDLSSEDSLEGELVRGGALPSLLRVIGAGGNPTAVVAACRALANCTFAPVHKAAALGAGAVPVLLSLLSGPLSSIEGVVDKACAALHRLTREHAGAEAVVAGGGVDVLVRLAGGPLGRTGGHAMLSLVELITSLAPGRGSLLAGRGVGKVLSFVKTSTPRTNTQLLEAIDVCNASLANEAGDFDEDPNVTRAVMPPLGYRGEAGGNDPKGTEV